MHTHVYEVEEQFGAEIWATAKAEKNIKNASGLVAPGRSRGIISYSTVLWVVGPYDGLEETGVIESRQGIQRCHFNLPPPSQRSRHIPVETLRLAFAPTGKQEKTAPFSLNFITHRDKRRG